MLQSPTFVLQLGYGILEICCVNVRCVSCRPDVVACLLVTSSAIIQFHRCSISSSRLHVTLCVANASLLTRVLLSWQMFAEMKPLFRQMEHGVN